MLYLLAGCATNVEDWHARLFVKLTAAFTCDLAILGANIMATS
jgi:hypothetical protein